MNRYYIETKKSCCYECKKANRPECRRECPEWAAHEAEKEKRYARERIAMAARTDNSRGQF